MKILLIILMGLLQLEAHAQQLKATRSYLSTEDGLCSNAVSRILQDGYGYIWIATWNGFSRYDGYEFFNYRTGSGSKVKNLHNRILDMAIDQSQNVWLYMYDYRVFVLNRTTDQIINPFENYSDSEEFWAECPFAVTTKGEVLVSIHDVGLFIMSLSKNGLKTEKVEGTGGLHINCIAEGLHNDLILGTNHGLYVLDRSTMKLEVKNPLTDEQILNFHNHNYDVYASTKSGAIYCISKNEDPKLIRKPTGIAVFNIFIDSHNLIWFCDDEMGASYIDPTTNKEKHFQQYVPVPERDGRGGNFNEVNGTLWILMNNGGYGYYNREADRVEYFHNNPANPWDISNTVYASLELPEGVIWESTSKRGIEKMELQKNNIVRVKPVPDATSTEENEFRAMFYDKEHKLLLLGNKRSSLFLYYDNGQKAIITHDSKGNPLGRIYGISKDSKGNFWISSKDHGVFKMSPNGRSWTIQNFCHEEGVPTSLSSNAAYYAVEDKDKNIWIATYGGGVNLLTKDKQGKTIFLHPKNGMNNYPRKTHLKVRTIEADAEGNVWAGTTDGVLILSYKDGHISIQKMRVAETENSKPLNSDIIYIKRDKDGKMWLGTNGGGLGHTIGKEKDGSWRFDVFDAQDGLPSEEIRSITFDEKGNAWFATEHIICSFNVDKRFITTFSYLDGVDETRISEGGAIMRGNGDILFGTLDGYYIVDRKKLMTSNGSLLRLQITDFLVSDVWQSPRLGSKIMYYVPESKSVEIPEGSTNFGFRFAALNYQLQHRIHYQYMLAGYDKDWKNADKMRLAIYNDVPSGKYKFKVKAFLLESPDNYDIRTMEVIVKGSLSGKAIVVWGIVILLLLTLSFLLYKYRNKFFKKHFKNIDVDKLEES